jgi:hypothetical protein
MNILSPKIHGVLDYVVVLVFLAAPKLLGLMGTAALLSYTLAAVHLGLTLLTDFPMGVLKVVPLSLHGWIELVVGPALIAAPWILGFAAQARIFYIVAGATIFITWCATDYRSPRPMS